MEDRCGRSSVGLVGLPEGMEGPDAAVFLRAGLSGWVPSLRGRGVGVGRARRVCGGGGGSGRPRALVFRVLGWRGGSDVLGGAWRACPVGCARNGVALLFFPGFGPAAAIGRGAFGPVLGRVAALGLRPFLMYPAVVGLRRGGERRGFGSPRKAEDFVGSVSRRGSCAAALRGGGGGAAAAVSPVRREGRDGLDGLGPSCPEGDDSRMAMDAC